MDLHHKIRIAVGRFNLNPDLRKAKIEEFLKDRRKLTAALNTRIAIVRRKAGVK